jgi:hypothetical protein
MDESSKLQRRLLLPYRTEDSNHLQYEPSHDATVYAFSHSLINNWLLYRYMVATRMLEIYHRPTCWASRSRTIVRCSTTVSSVVRKEKGLAFVPSIQSHSRFECSIVPVAPRDLDYISSTKRLQTYLCLRQPFRSDRAPRIERPHFLAASSTLRSRVSDT